MPKNTTQCPRPGLEPGPLDPGTSALTTRPMDDDFEFNLCWKRRALKRASESDYIFLFSCRSRQIKLIFPLSMQEKLFLRNEKLFSFVRSLARVIMRRKYSISGGGILAISISKFVLSRDQLELTLSWSSYNFFFFSRVCIASVSL